MMIFDIDGTLIPYGCVKITPSALAVIDKLKKKKDVKVMMGLTGRAKCFIQDDIFDSLHSDYLVTINGQSTLDKDFVHLLNIHHL